MLSIFEAGVEEEAGSTRDGKQECCMFAAGARLKIIHAFPSTEQALLPLCPKYQVKLHMSCNTSVLQRLATGTLMQCGGDML